MYQNIYNRETQGNMTSVEGRRINKVDIEVREAIGKILAKHGFDPARLQTQLYLIPCEEIDCSTCGLSEICKQAKFKNRIIQLQCFGRACDKG